MSVQSACDMPHGGGSFDSRRRLSSRAASDNGFRRGRVPVSAGMTFRSLERRGTHPHVVYGHCYCLFNLDLRG